MNYYSQHGEDYILDKIFSNKKTGFFIEIGCIDGKRYSNTLHFEKKGWTGLCIEAHAGFIEDLKKNRPNSKVIHAAIGEENKEEIDFFANSRGSLSTIDKSMEEEFKERYKEFFTGFETQKVSMCTIDSIIDEYNVKHIDFLSLDIEGYEKMALLGFDLTKHKPLVMVIETDNDKNEQEIDELVLPHGYYKSIKIGANRFYLLDKKKAKLIENKKFKFELTHTEHILDNNGDVIFTKIVDTRRKILIKIITKMIRWIFFKK